MFSKDVDLREHIAHIRAQQLEHLRATYAGSFGLHGGQSKLELSGKEHSKLTLSKDVDGCKPLPSGPHGGATGTQSERASGKCI